MQVGDEFAVYLDEKADGADALFLSFAELESLIGFPLPNLAREDPRWWLRYGDTSPVPSRDVPGWSFWGLNLDWQEVWYVREGTGAMCPPERWAEAPRWFLGAGFVAFRRGTVDRDHPATISSLGQKYENLRRFLRAVPSIQTQLMLSFDELVDILWHDLPKTALGNRTWWANGKSNPQAAAWLSSGWEVRAVYLRARLVVFCRLAEEPFQEIPAYVKKILGEGKYRGKPNGETIYRWIRFCRNVGWYFEGTVLYEKGGLALDALSETERVEIEEDYAVCKRELLRYKAVSVSDTEAD